MPLPKMPSHHPAGTNIAAAPIGAVQGRYADPNAGGRMNELTVAKIDAHMRHPRTIRRKEYQISRHELTCRRTYFILNICRARKMYTSMCKYILYIAGAVKTAGAGTTKYIRHAKVLHGFGNNRTIDVVAAMGYYRHGFA